MEIGDVETDSVTDLRGNLLRALCPGLGGGEERQKERQRGPNNPQKMPANRRLMRQVLILHLFIDEPAGAAEAIRAAASVI